MANIRQSILEHIDLLAHPAKQLSYESSVPQADIHGELISGFCSDLFDPKSKEFVAAFTDEELRDLSHLYGLLMEAKEPQHGSVGRLLKQPEWRRVVSFSKQLHDTLVRAPSSRSQ